MISIIVAPPTAPQVLPPARSKPKLRTLNQAESQIVDAVQEHGVVKLWPIIDELVLKDGKVSRAELRQRRRELYTTVYGLIQSGMLIWAGRNCIALPGTRLPILVQRRRSPVAYRHPRLAGSARTEPQLPRLTIPAIEPDSQPVAVRAPLRSQPARPPKTESAASPEQITEAARSLATLPRDKARRWTGWIDGQRSWRGRLVLTPAGDVLPLVMANRGRVLLQETSDAELSPIEIWRRTVWRSEQVQLVRNPAAVLLGRLKLGVVERPSAAKQRAARMNGLRPCRPGLRRGRPVRVTVVKPS